MQPLIDFDVICYRAGYVCKGDYLMGVEAVENMLYGIVQRFPDDPKGFLTGKGNFRYTLDPTYKANRDPSKRPYQLANLREYLVDFWSAEISEGCEADDLMGLAHGENTVICSNDKDLKTIVGYNYNFVTDTLEYIDEQQALTNFYIQMLIGDKADNVPGIRNPIKAHHKNPPNFTEDSAKKLLEGQEDIVIEQYKAQEGDNWKQLFDQRANLLWIQQKRGKTYEEFKTNFSTASDSDLPVWAG